MRTTWRYRVLHALRRLTFWLSIKVSPGLFSSLYFRCAFAALNERRRMIGFTGDGPQPAETTPKQ